MKYIKLETISDFKCTGADCPSNCCAAGWKISIDPETDAFYQSVTGEMGERLKKGIQRENGKAFILQDERGICPFLNECGLCDIYIHLGEEHMGDTCTTYPRYSFFIGDIYFAGVSISCPEVAKFFVNHKDRLQIDFSEDENVVPDEESVDWNLFNHSIRTFSTAVDIAQNRELPIRERVALILILVDLVQAELDEGLDPREIIDLFCNPEVYRKILDETDFRDKDYSSKSSFCSEVLNYFGGVPDDKCPPELRDLIGYYALPNHAEITRNALCWFDDERDSIWLENVLVYILFRFFMKEYDYRIFNKSLIKGILLLLNMVACVLSLQRSKNGVATDKDALYMLISHVSRSIEHNSTFEEEVLTHFSAIGMTDLSFLLSLIS